MVLESQMVLQMESQNYIFFFCPRLLKGRDGDGFPQYQEKFIRDCIRKFPYCEATLLQQLVRSIAPVEIVSTLFYHNKPTHFNLTKESHNVESLIKYFIKNILYVILFIKILLYY